MAFFSDKRSRVVLRLPIALLALSASHCYAQQFADLRYSRNSSMVVFSIPDTQLAKSSLDFQRSVAPRDLRDISFSRPLESSPLARNPSWENSVSMIGRMEAAFYCNDTPFIDQVRLPLATLWGGRIKLIGFESDVTTANFVLGLPGGGTLHSLSMFGSGHLATWTPPSDQLAGINMVFTLRGSDAEPAR